MRAVKEWADTKCAVSVQDLFSSACAGLAWVSIAEASSEALGDLLSLLEAREIEPS
jgi:hypothetical protein